MLVDLFDIARFLVFCLIITIGVFAIVLLHHLILLVKRTNHLIDANSGHINKAVSALPDTVNNINSVALTIKDNIDKAGEAVGSLGTTVAETAASVNESTGNLLEFIGIISRTVKIIMGLLSKD